MSWSREEFQLLRIDEVAKLILNLDDEFNHIETIESVITEVTIQGNGGFLCGSEVSSDD